MLLISKNTIAECSQCKHTIITSYEEHYIIEKPDDENYYLCEYCYESTYGKPQLVGVS